MNFVKNGSINDSLDLTVMKNTLTSLNNARLRLLKSESVTTDSTFSKTTLTFTISHASFIIVSLKWSNSAALEIGVSDAELSSERYCDIRNASLATNGSGCLYASGILLETTSTYVVWARSLTGGTSNVVRVYGIDLI